GGFSDHTAEVVVANVAPTGSQSNNSPVLVGSSAEVTLTGLGDASAADVAAGLDWSVDLDGDGTDEASGTWTTGDAAPTETVPASVLDDVGSFEVLAAVQDKDGGVLVLSTILVVNPTTPTATLGGDSVPAGGTAEVTFSAPVDAAPGA